MIKTRLGEIYDNELVARMTEKSGYKNPMQALKLNKIAINMGVGEAKESTKVFEAAIRDLEIIASQKAVITKSKKSVVSFKVREDMPIGYKVTLCGEKMCEFVGRLISLASPCVRDFRGVSLNSFDGRGSYAMSIKGQLIFPEIEYDKIDKVRGMDIIFVATAQTDEKVCCLLTLSNMSLAK